MKPLALNLSKMKKVGGDKNSSTFLHPNGHKMVIAHSGVSALQRKQLESMPITEDPENTHAHPDVKPQSESSMLRDANDLYGNPHSVTGEFADGGASDDAAPDASPDDSDRGPAGSTSIPVASSPDQVQIPESMATQPAPASSGPAPASTSGSSGGSDPFALNAVYAQERKAMDLQSKGEQNANTLKAQALTNQAQFEHDFQTKQKELMDNYQGYMGHFMDQDQKLQGDIAKGAINPNRYLQNMSTGQKIGTAIGLILGGAGAARTGQNVAYDYLNKQIDRDIDAQKANLNEGNNLLANNLKVMGNMTDATKLTQIQLGDLVHSQLAEQADKIATPLAAAQNQTIQGQWAQKKAELQKQLALSQAMINSGGGGSEGHFQGTVQFLRMNGMNDMAKALEEHHVPGVSGAASVPVSEPNRASLNQFNNLDDLLGRASDYLDKVGSLGPGWQNSNKALGQSLEEQINLGLNQLSQQNRFTEQEDKHYHGMKPDLTGTHFTGQDRAKLESLRTELQEKRKNLFQSVGMNPPQSINTGSSELRRVVRTGPHAGKIAIYDRNKKFLRWGN